MSVIVNIPNQANPLFNKLEFKAIWNPATGLYDFNTALNTGVKILDFQNSAPVLLASFTIGADINGEIFTDSIQVVPSLTFKYEKKNTNVYHRPLTVPQLTDNRELMVWCASDEDDDRLLVDFRGVLKQVPETVGNDEIRMFCAIDGYEVDATWFDENYKTPLSRMAGQASRGQLG